MEAQTKKNKKKSEPCQTLISSFKRLDFSYFSRLLNISEKTNCQMLSLAQIGSDPDDHLQRLHRDQYTLTWIEYYDENIARVQNCPDFTILHSLFVFRLFVFLSFCLLVVLSFCLFVVFSVTRRSRSDENHLLTYLLTE